MFSQVSVILFTGLCVSQHGFGRGGEHHLLYTIPNSRWPRNKAVRILPECIFVVESILNHHKKTDSAIGINIIFLVFLSNVIYHYFRFRTLIGDRKRGKRLKRIHQRQRNRPAAPLPPTWHYSQAPTTLQGLQEYRVLVDSSDPPLASAHTNEPSNPYASIQTNQSTDTYAVPYQHMLGRFIAFMTMYQRHRPARSATMAPDLIPPEHHSGDTSNGYLEPRSTHHYQELNEASLLANRPTEV